MVLEHQSRKALISSIGTPSWYAKEALPLQKEWPAHDWGLMPVQVRWSRNLVRNVLYINTWGGRESFSTQEKAWLLEAGVLVRLKACVMARFGYNLLQGIGGKGISKTHSRNWMAFLQWMVTKISQQKNQKSSLLSCLDGSNWVQDRGSKWDFQYMP